MRNQSIVFMCCLQKAAKKTVEKTAAISAALALVAGLIGTAAIPLAEASQQVASADFSVDFVDCNEFVGITPVPLVNIDQLIPMEYTPLTADLFGSQFNPDDAVVVIRTASCNDVSINGGPSRPAMVAQFGVSVFPPVSGADIDNYTLTYVTDDQELADRLNNAGVRAHWSPQSKYKYKPVAMGEGKLKVQVKRPKKAAYKLRGVVFDAPLFPPGPFIANWWQANNQGNTQMETDIPEITFGDGSDVTMKVKPGTWIADALGATELDFPILSVRGLIPSAVMHVTTGIQLP